MNGSRKSIIQGCVGIVGALLLYGCATVGETPVADGTLFPNDGTKGKAFLLQKPHELLTRGFRDGKLALVNIIDITGKFGISEIQYGLVALALCIFHRMNPIHLFLIFQKILMTICTKVFFCIGIVE